MKYFFLILLFVVTVFAMNANPFNFGDPFKVLYSIPFVIAAYNVYNSYEYRAKGLFDEPKYLNALKSIVLFLSYLVAANVQIPYLSKVVEALTNILGNYEQIGQAVNFLIGLAGGIYSIFASGDSALGYVAKRLEGKTIEPRKKYL